MDSNPRAKTSHFLLPMVLLTSSISIAQPQALSDADFAAYLDALQLKRETEWQELHRRQAVRTRYLAQSADFSDSELRRIGIAVDAVVNNRLVGQLKANTLKRIELDDVSVRNLETEISNDKSVPERWLLWNIFLFFPEGGGESGEAATMHSLEAIRARVQSGEDFESLARKHSESSSRFDGGRIGWTRKQRVSPALGRVLDNLRADQYSDVVRTAKGVSFYFVEAFRPAAVVSRARLIARMKTKKLKQKRASTWQAVLEAAGESAEIEIGTRWLPEQEGEISDGTEILRNGQYALTFGDLRQWQVSISGGKQVARQIDPRALAKRFLQMEALASNARTQGLALPDSEKEWLRMHFVAEKELARLTSLQLKPITAAEVEAHYVNNKGGFRTQKRWDFSMLQFDFEPLSQQWVKQLAQETMHGLSQGSLSFAEVAKSHSPGDLSKSGGRLGLRSKQQIRFLDAVAFRTLQAMKPGQLEGPIPGKNRMLILKLHAIEASRQKEISEAAAEIRKLLGEQAYQDKKQAILAGLPEPSAGT